MWLNWKDSQRTVGTMRPVRTIWANDQGRFLRGWPPYQRLSLTLWVDCQSKGHGWDQDMPFWMNVCEEAGGCHCSRNIFRRDCVHSHCWVAVSYCSSFSRETSSTFKLAYSTCTHFLQLSMVGFCFFATDLVGYGFRFSFQPAFCIAMRVPVTVDDRYFRVGHLKEGYGVLQFGAYAYSQTLDNNKFHHCNFYSMILFCKLPKALKWLSVLTDTPSCRRCTSAVRHLSSNHAAWILRQCVPQVVGEPSQATAGHACALSNSITSALLCFPGSKNSAQPWEERDCRTDWAACVCLCHRLLCRLLCFRLVMKSKQLTGCAKWLALNAVF